MHGCDTLVQPLIPLTLWGQLSLDWVAFLERPRTSLSKIVLARPAGAARGYDVSFVTWHISDNANKEAGRLEPAITFGVHLVGRGLLQLQSFMRMTGASGTSRAHQVDFASGEVSFDRLTNRLGPK